MADITVANLDKYFGDKQLLKDISFEIMAGEKVAVVGPNGAGKTTLFKILTGSMPYDKGVVAIDSSRTVGIIDQIPVYREDMTVEDVLRSAFHRLDEMKVRLRQLEETMKTDTSEKILKQYGDLSVQFEMLDGYNLDSRISKVCNGLEISESQRSQPFAVLSGGEKTRVNLARIILENTDILLLDEPTNHLDLEAVAWLGDFLDSYPGTVVTISHDRYFLDQCCNRIIELNDGVCDFYAGSYSYYAVERERRLEAREQEYHRQMAEIQDLQERSTRMHQWGTEKMHKRAASIDKRIARMKVSDRPKHQKKMHMSFGEPDFETEDLLFVKNICKNYDGKQVLDDISFTVRGGDRIAILGDNGTGKTTLLKILLGLETADSGSIRKADGLKPSYLPQQVVFQDPSLTLIDTLFYEKRVTTQTARNRLGAFQFPGETQFKPVSALSGGEKSRLKLCMLMYDPLNMLVLDEPTNHLDIQSREWIEDAVEAFTGTLLFVSHDRYFISRFANRILTLEHGHITDFKGNYEEYLSFREREPAPKAEAPKKEKKEKPKAKGGTKNIAKKVAVLEREIAQLEEQIAQCEEQMAQFASDPQKLLDLTAESQALNDSLLEKMEAWEAQSLLLDEA